MRDNIGRIFAEALSTKDEALQTADLVETDRELGLNCFNGLVVHTASRIRNVVNVRGYEKAGIEYAEVVAILVERTTEICKEMNGRMIPVTKMSETVNNILSIPIDNRPVEEVRNDLEKVVPFWKDKDTRKIAGSKTSDLLSMGVALPPYHWRCRTKTAAWFEENIKPIKLTAGADISAETKKYYKN